MLITRSHIPWFLFVLVASVVAGVLYCANFHPGQVTFFKLPAMFGPVPPLRNTVGGTPLGLLFGTISYLCFLIAAGLGLRKKRRTWPIGHVQLWMKLHIWLTTLTVPLVLFHCGLHFGGPMTTALMWLYGIVMVSGFYGLGLQQFMPGLMARRLPHEAVFEAIPQVREELVEAAEKLWRELAPGGRKAERGVHEGTEPHLQEGGSAVSVLVAPMPEVETDAQSRKSISEFLHDQIFPYLRAENGRGHRLANARVAEGELRSLKLACSPKWQPQVGLMEQWVFDRRNLDSQTRMQHWLHIWLLVHVPFSFILIVFTFWHAYVTITYL
jgi:hypothetical protein